MSAKPVKHTDDEACGYKIELERSLQEVLDLKAQYESMYADLSSILAAEDELTSCLRLHVEGYFENLSPPPQPERLNFDTQVKVDEDMGCEEALRALLTLRSRASSLNFMLAELRGFLINEIIRLAGLVGLCRHYEPELAEKAYSNVLDVNLRRYLAL